MDRKENRLTDREEQIFSPGCLCVSTYIGSVQSESSSKLGPDILKTEYSENREANSMGHKNKDFREER